MTDMVISILACLTGFVVLLGILRYYGVSLGLPAAYLLNLLLIHVPGAVAHVLDHNRILPGREFTSVGILFTALGTACFVAGVFFVHFRAKAPVPTPAPRTSYWKFCLLAGWISTAVAFVFNVPSISAVILKGGAIWMLGIMLALQSSLRRGDAAMAWRCKVRGSRPANEFRIAQQLFLEALQTANRQGAKSFELRAAVSLCRLHHDFGRSDGSARLRAVHDWFTEGFSTPDFQQAKQLLNR